MQPEAGGGSGAEADRGGRMVSWSSELETKGRSSSASGQGGPRVRLAKSNSFRGERTRAGSHDTITFALALGPGHPGVWGLSVPGAGPGAGPSSALQETEEEGA